MKTWPSFTLVVLVILIADLVVLAADVAWLIYLASRGVAP